MKLTMNPELILMTFNKDIDQYYPIMKPFFNINIENYNTSTYNFSIFNLNVEFLIY